MTKDECLGAISEAFKNVRAEAVVGYWNIHIYSKPPRELILSGSFVARNVEGDGMTPDALRDHIKTIPDSRWATCGDGSLMLLLN